MTVAADVAGQTVTIAITFDAPEVLADRNLTDQERNQRVLHMAMLELRLAMKALVMSDAALDASVAAKAAEVAKMKASRPTVNL